MCPPSWADCLNGLNTMSILLAQLSAYYSHRKKRTGLRRVLGLIAELRAGEGFLLAEKRVIRRPVLITQTSTSTHLPAQSLCRRCRHLQEVQECVDSRDDYESCMTGTAYQEWGVNPAGWTAPTAVISQHAQFQCVRLSKFLDSRNGELGRRRANEALLDVITAELIVETGPADLEQLGRL